MRINTNMAALNAWRNLTVNRGNMQKSLEKLSSGYRINRAADDAAGLAVSEKMSSQLRGINMATRNTQDGISLVQTAEGGASAIQDMLQRMRELAVQSSTGSLEDADRTQLQNEFQELAKEIDRTAGSTKFNNQSLLDGTVNATAGDSGRVSGATVGSKATAFGVYGSPTVDTGATPASNTISKTADYQVLATTSGSDTALKLQYKDSNDTWQDVSGAAATLTGGTKGQVKMAGMVFDIDVTGASDLATGTVAGTFHIDVGAQSNFSIQVGANNGDKIDFALDKLTGDALGITDGNGALNTSVTIAKQDSAKTAIDTLDTALSQVTSARAKMGAYQNRLENTITTQQTMSENLTAAQSRIKDVDMASEMAQFTKYQVLQQAGTAMLAQANQLPQGIMSLLR
jgi:flagellin